MWWWYGGLLAIVAFVAGIMLRVGRYEIDLLNLLLDTLPVNRDATRDYLRLDGFDGERHELWTEDGYRVTVYRMLPLSLPSGRPVVFLQHGTVGSSVDWLRLGPRSSLLYQLHRAGYDVWLGNSRSSHQSHGHRTVPTSARRFWSYSWHEMGLHDLRTMLDFVLRQTNQSKLQYVGYSEGCTVALVLLSCRPEYNGKIHKVHALAPAAFVMNTDYRRYLWIPRTLMGLNLPFFYCFYPLPRWVAEALLAVFSIRKRLLGPKGDRASRTDSRAHPGGASAREFYHFAQVMSTGRFAMYDYGSVENWRTYGADHSPEYATNEITVPMDFYYGRLDLISDWVGVERLADKLRRTGVSVTLRALDNYKHGHFIVGGNVSSDVYEPILTSMQSS